MTPDPLVSLLTRTDAASPPPPPGAAELATAVRANSARRARKRRVTAVCVSLIVCAGLLGSALDRFHPRRTAAPAVDVAQIREELARLDSEARLHEKSARALEAAADVLHRRAAAQRLITSDPINRLREQREITAAILLHQATKLALRPETRDTARRELTQAASLFSDTTGGRKAAAMLDRGV
jgi:hypothetical protein